MPKTDSKAELSSAAQVILGADPQMAVYGEAVVWLHKVELFRQDEDARMYRRKPEHADLRLHRELLLRLIADGEHLLRLVEQNGVLANSAGITAADLNATLENLRADYRGWHEPLAPAQKEQILREVFDGAKPAH